MQIEAQGDEVGASFTLNFNTAHLSNPQNITLGSGATGGMLTFNTNEANQGRVGIVIDRAPNQPLVSGTRQLATIEFDVAMNAPSTTTINFGDAPVVNEVANGNAASLKTTFSTATISLLGPTAASVSIGGRVTTPSGKGILNARVYLTDAAGETRYALTDAFGKYRFSEVAAGATYILNVSAKRYNFGNPTRVVSVNEDDENINFAALE